MFLPPAVLLYLVKGTSTVLRLLRANYDTQLLACKGHGYYCSWRALRVEAEDSSREVLQFACSFGVGEGTRDLIEHV